METQKNITLCRDRETLKKNAKNFFHSFLSLELNNEQRNDTLPNPNEEKKCDQISEEKSENQLKTETITKRNLKTPSLIESIHRIFGYEPIKNMNHEEKDDIDLIKTIKRPKILTRQIKKEEMVDFDVSKSDNQKNSAVFVKINEEIAFEKLSEFFKEVWCNPIELYEDLHFHNENCCQLEIFKLEPIFSKFKENCDKRKNELINEIIEMKEIPRYLVQPYGFSAFFKCEFEITKGELIVKRSTNFKSSYERFLQALKENEKQNKKEDFDAFKRKLLERIHKNLEYKVRNQISFYCLRRTDRRRKLEDLITKYVDQNKLKIIKPSSNIEIRLNENQLRLYLEDKWIKSEILYEALTIHKTRCCDYPPLHFEEDKILFQQQYEQKKEKNIYLMLKINDFPDFHQEAENPMHMILRLNSKNFKAYPCFGQQYFEKYEQEIEEKKKNSTEQEFIESRQDFIHFYHAKLDYMYAYMIFRHLKKVDYKSFKKG